MRFGRWIVALLLPCCLAAPAHAGTKQTCKSYLAEHRAAIGILPEITGLDTYVAAPDDAALRVTAFNLLGHQETDSLQALAERIAAAWESREECAGDVGKKITVDGTSVNPAEFVAYVEALHDHGLPLLSRVVDERTADARAEAERARTEREIGTLTATWGETVAGLAARRGDDPSDPAAVAALRSAIADAGTLAGRCLARAYLLRVRPLGDDFADDVRPFAPCLDLPEGAAPRDLGDLVREQGFLGAVDSRDRALRAGRADRAIREWTALLEVFGGERGGPWSDAAHDGLPDPVRALTAGAADLEWPMRSRVGLGLYCLSRKETACVEAQFAGGGDDLDVSEAMLASIADDLGEAGNPLAVDLWEFLEARGIQGTTYLQKRVAFQVAHEKPSEVREEISGLIAAGECARAVRMLSMVSSSSGSPVSLAEAETLRPCTAGGDADAVGAAWGVIGDAYANALSDHMQADPQELREAVALARKALAIPDAFRSRSVTDYARFVLEVSEQRASGTVDTARARQDRFDGCTQTLAAIEWKRRKEDDSYRTDLASLRAHCCSFLQSNRAEWVAWMRSGPESSDDRGRTFRREFTPDEVANKQAGLDRYCADR